MISACMTVSVRELRTAVREWACWGWPASVMPFEWHSVGGPMWVQHSVLAGLTCHDLQNEKIDYLCSLIPVLLDLKFLPPRIQ